MMPRQPPPVPTVTASEAHRLMADGARLIDVRERDEWDKARIPGADLKPMSQINEWYQGLPRDGTIVVHCHTGDRSAQVVNALTHQADFDNVKNLSGGIVGWSDAGLPIETGAVDIGTPDTGE